MSKLLTVVGSFFVGSAHAAGLSDLISSTAAISSPSGSVAVWVDAIIAILVSIGLVFFGYKLFRRMTGR